MVVVDDRRFRRRLFHGAKRRVRAVSAWARFRAWPVSIRVPAMAAVGVAALGLGYGLGNFVPAGKAGAVRPVTALLGTTTSEPHEIRVDTPTTAGAGAGARNAGAATATTVAAAVAGASSPTTVAAAARAPEPPALRVTCDAIALEVLGRVLTTSEAAEAVRLYQDQRTTPQPAIEAFCREWLRAVPKVPVATGAPNLQSSTN